MAQAHPLGNFTINHFARIEVGDSLVRLRYVVDMAEIPTFQELRAMTAGESDTPSEAALDAYLQRVAAQYADGLAVIIDGSRVPLKKGAATIKTLPGAGGLQTLRVECDYEGAFPTATDESAARRLRFEDLNNSDRIGWHEIVVVPSSGTSIFNSSAFANGVTDEIKAYPQDMLQAPLNERVAELSFTRGAVPAGARLLQTREGRPFVQERDRFSELINVKELTPTLALLGLLIAVALGAVHALSPGHGKTIVGAYLIGSRGTARHAVFLGLTVTITHTIGVFALGLVTLFASRYIMPERLFPVLGLISGALVFVVGLSLFIRRLRTALKPSAHDETHHEHAHHHNHNHLHDDEHKHSHAHLHDHAHSHEHPHIHEHAHSHEHTHSHDDESGVGVHDVDVPVVAHSHGGSSHTHLPPGARGDRVTWRSLLALGISGGLLPCPSALVVMLSAIALHRVAYGLILVVAFSFGLACTLTCIGLAFVYAGRLMKGRINAGGRMLRWLPAMSAFVIACLGAAICYQALGEAGIHPLALLSSLPGGQIISLSTLGVLVLVLVFGLKYAVEAQRRGAQRKVK
ncbi:MAG: nickel/cobalt transporter (NicO) family protein [Acidobacteriota bacterium]|jgi:ABC-type nickel/cobalt efflux system permease component RcnA|nr:nickel/cobalt transporter (NicO) family protein [Acidobacteriota bacterium]